MNKLLVLITCILPCILFSVTRTVALDGSQQYTSIQVAVNDSRNGDVVQVFPGRYEENIEFIDYHVSLVSLYATDPQQQYIENTIIDGNLGSCIRIVDGETITINGFTLVNNEENIDAEPYLAGGGIYLKDYSTGNVYNCIIRNCLALSGGGICSSTDSSFFLSNVLIYNNRAIVQGGGLAFNNSDALTFDNDHPSSIYNNYASQGMDVCVYYTQANQNPITISLNMGSIALSEPDGYFVNVHNANVSVTLEQGCIDLIDSDLFIAPNGDDNNSGLSVDSPLKTIAYAMQKIASNQDNPRTLHLASGIYSPSANDQILPSGVKSHIRIQGAGMDETVIDGEFLHSALEARYADNIAISDMKIIN